MTVGSLPRFFRKLGWVLCPGLFVFVLVNLYALWSRDTAYLGTGFWHLYPFVAMWIVLSSYLGILWTVVAAAILWARWGRGVTSEKIEVAIVALLIIAAYGSEHLAVWRLLG